MSTGMWRRGAASHEEPGTPKLVRPDPAEGFADEVAGHLLAPADGEIGVVNRLGARVGQASRLLDRVLSEGPAAERRLSLARLDRRHRDGPEPDPGFSDHAALEAGVDGGAEHRKIERLPAAEL